MHEDRSASEAVKLCRVKTVVLATLSMCIFWLAEQMGAEPLLSCVLTGIVVTNRTGEVSQSTLACCLLMSRTGMQFTTPAQGRT